MELWKIFDKTMRGVVGVGGRGGGCREKCEHCKHNSISLHFCELQQHVFLLFQSLDVSALENLSHNHVFQSGLLINEFKSQNVMFFLVFFSL